MSDTQQKPQQSMHQVNFEELKALHTETYETQVKDQLRQLRLVLASHKWSETFVKWSLNELVAMAEGLQGGSNGSNS